MYADQQAKPAYRGETNSGIAGAAGERSLEVPAELSRLEKAVEFATGSLAELCSRLEGKVARGSDPQPAQTTGSGLVSVGPSTMFGQEVRGNSSRIEGLGERIQDLLRRLEV